jgi:sulfite exporter TauE/SafE
VTGLLVSAALLGLLGGMHCVAMCGGITAVLCSSLPPHARQNPLRQLPYALAYNFGRIGSYALAGLVAGGFGALTYELFSASVAQRVLRSVAALTMVGIGLYLAGLFRAFGALEGIGLPLWRRVEPFARKLLPVKTPKGALALGGLWGFLPCGMVYTALVMALGAGSAAKGSLVMLAFGLGTLPTLLTMSVLASAVARLSQLPWVRRGSGALVAAFGVFALVSLLGQSPAIGAKPTCCSGHTHAGSDTPSP